MKKIIILICLFFICSCGNDSETDDISIIGSWEYSNEDLFRHYDFYSDYTFHMELEYTNSDYTMNEDGNYSIHEKVETCSGDEATIIILTILDDDLGDYSLEFVYKVDGDALYIEVQDTPIDDPNPETSEDCYSLTYNALYLRVD